MAVSGICLRAASLKRYNPNPTMALTSGTRLGPYEIVAPLGAGGMGEVYRARDPRLGREVAIKVLPASFCGDLERVKVYARIFVAGEADVAKLPRGACCNQRLVRAISVKDAIRIFKANDFVVLDQVNAVDV